MQFSDARFHRWLESVGLAPRKSLTLGRLDVPAPFVLPTVRGLFEGDGHIENFVHRPTVKKYPDYVYERLRVSFNSASRAHIEWIASAVAATLHITGWISELPPRPGSHALFRLTYGKHASIALLQAIYPSPDVPMLERKWKVWNDYARRNSLT